MTGTNPSGTLGHVQLIAFANEGSLEAVKVAAHELGYVRAHIAAGDAKAAKEYLSANASPELLLVEIGNADEAPAELDALADVVNPHTRVLATGKVDSIRFYQWLSDLGIDGYLLQPFTAAELKQAIAKGAAKKAETKGDKEEIAHKVVAVIGARGGVGTTMLATNLGAIFASHFGRTTAIADLDVYFGSVALSLDLEPGKGLRDAFEKPDRVDALFLERVMVKLSPTLSILSAEEPLADAINTQPNAGEMIFAALREKFQVIVVDVPRQMNPLTRHVLMLADHVLIVAEPQITSLRDSLRIRDYLVEQLKRPAPMLLLNRVGMSPSNELSPKEFAKNFGSEITAQFGYMQEAIAATAQGALMTSVPKLKELVIPLRRIVKVVIGKAEGGEEKKKAAPAPSGGLMSKLKGKK